MQRKVLKQKILSSMTRHARLILVVCVLVIGIVLFKDTITTFLGIGRIQAASYQMQTGYYVGNGSLKEISGLGFTPEVVILKADTIAGTGAVMKTISMPQNNVAYLGVASADDVSAQIQLTADGFLVTGSLSDTTDTTYTWVAFSGTDCSAGGQLCIGTYTGTGTGSQTVQAGFAPDLVIVKQSSAVAANWRSSVMPDNFGQYFMATAQDTVGALFLTLDATGFTVGATNNTLGGTYYFVAFKETANVIDVGSYTGNGVDNTSIATVGFEPDWVFTKQTGAVPAVYNVTESNGNSSSYFTDAVNVVGAIKALESNGFQVGTSNTVNADTVTYYYAGFGGTLDPTADGTFTSVSGSYTGNGSTFVISNLGFSPDLVVITASSTEYSVFKTRMMGGDSTAYLGNAAANFSGGITTLSPNGFAVGSHNTVNQSGIEYHWVAYGNAWNPETKTGASDFVVGAYFGNGLDDRSIGRLPFQPDMLTVKVQGTSEGVWRSSEHIGDLTGFFHASGETSDAVQALTATGFQVGTSAFVNSANSVYWYFGFATGTNFAVGTYTGTGVARTEVTSFQPDQAWVKNSGAVQGVLRTSSVTSSSSFPFINIGPVIGALEGLTSSGLLLGTAAEANTGSATYRYAVWQDTTTLGSATFAMQTGYYIGNGSSKEIRGLGFTPDVVILKADSVAGLGAMLKTTAMAESNTAYLSGATADDTSGAVLITQDGFRVVGAISNTTNSRYTWVAFSGNDCTASGKLCVGGYTGDGGATKALVTGFTPDLVLVKRSSTEAPNWRSSAMPSNYAQFFAATTQDTAGTYFTTLDASGFTVGSTNNASGGNYYMVAFKEVAGSIDVGTYVGNTVVGRSITGFGMAPDFVFTKNANTAVSAVYSVEESNTNYTSYFTDTANVTNAILRFESDGIQVGSHTTAHENGSTFYYASFSGAAAPSGVGTFNMNSGSYVGTGNTKLFSNIGFTPDLVIIKSSNGQAGVFATCIMGTDLTAYLDAATVGFAGGITALRPDGFTIGTNATVNTVGVTYYWTAFSNAWNPETNSGSADFVIGAYSGNGVDSRNIGQLPFQPDLVTIKRSGATGGTWRTASHVGDSSSFFSATANGTNRIQALNANGFQVGTDAGVNTLANLYWYFAFATSTTFEVGTYSGTGSSQNITVGFQPYQLWVKRNGATQGVERFSVMSGDGAYPFIAGSLVTNAITGLTTTGFTVNTAPETNTLSDTYFYAAWKKNILEQMHYHFRADDGDEETATSLTSGVEDTPLGMVYEGVPYRIRLGISNEGEVHAVPASFRLEYAVKAGTCSAASGWTRVSAAGGAWDMYDSPNLTEGSDTTNVAVGDGGVTDENTVYLAVNGGVRDTSDETGALTLLASHFVDIEYAVQATEFAADGTTYCFRVSDSGNPLSLYEQYPEASFSTHVVVQATGTQTTTLIAPSANNYLGGAFVFSDNGSNDTHSITDIQVSEGGTVDASAGLANIKLFYEYDTTAPYDCAGESYTGTETQYGLTAGSFSGADGIAVFSDSVVASSTQAVCMYPVLDVTTSALSNETIELYIATSSDITLTGGQKVRMTAPVELGGTTTVVAPLLNQMHYHFRLDDGSESGASSATGGSENTTIENLMKATPRRVRVEVSNEGLATSSATVFRLEYALRNGTCAATAAGWTDVAGAGGAWDMFDSTYLTEGDDTTNIAVGSGGVTDENSVFLATNGGVRDTTSETGSLTLAPNEFVELEYAITALAGALDGESYCFRVTDQGSELEQYSSYPELSLVSDVVVSALGSHTPVVRAGATDTYMGGSFVIQDVSSSRDITSITLTESGSIDANQHLANIRLYYDFDTVAPYNCAGESYSGGETQFGSTVGAFSSPNGTATFTDTVPVSTVSSVCVYMVLDVAGAAQDADTVLLSLANPSTDVVVSTGTVNPNDAIGPTGSTTITRPTLALEHFHFRLDDGGESDASSATNGIEDLGLTDVLATDPQRLRVAVSNKGSTSTLATAFTLQYTERVSTCSAGVGWQEVGSSGAVWSVSESSTLTGGDDTTNIAVSTGGVSDEATTFITPNGGVIERSATSPNITLSDDSFVELEYVLEANGDASAGSTYCFRVVANSEVLDTYETYPEATITSIRDFFIQRGVSTIVNGTSSISIVAGSDYVAPSSNTSAFLRITNSSQTGAGAISGGGSQNANQVTTSILNPGDIETGITFVRSGTSNSTKIYWEIIEYTGPVGGDNEIVVRAQSRVTYDSALTSVSTPSASGVTDDNDVVVFITGQQNPDTSVTEYHAGISTAAWNSGSDSATFTRGVSDSIAATVSYAIVEFTGINWKIQRSEHTYVTPGAVEYENITPVNDLSRTFLHTQKRVGVNQIDEFGQQVWLSSVGQIYFTVPDTAASISTHVGVVWVIENTQTNGTPMVVTRSNGTQTLGGTEPGVYSIAIGKTLAATNNASIFMNMLTLGNYTAHPQAIMGAGITSTTNYELWISDTGSSRSYRTEVVEWPTAELTMSQDYYRWYVNNDALDPTDAWPAGVVDIGENTAITSYDAPPTDGDILRLRMSVAVRGSNISQETRQFKLQYGTRETTCGAIGAWYDIGDSASSTTLWRGYNATPLDGTALSTNPPTLGDLNLSVSDRAGTFEEANPTALNPYKILIGDDVEFDWILEANGVSDFTSYCFRMTEADGTELHEYTYYPTVGIAGFYVEQQDWRWYDDETSETPTVPFAASNTAPSNIQQAELLKLRVLVDEQAGRDGLNTKFKLQWSEYSDFSVVNDVADVDTCLSGSMWCYANGAGAEGVTITANVLEGADTCSGGVGDGCGTHNEYSYTPDVVGEVGTTTTDSNGTTVVLQHTYDDPVFIVESISGDVTGGAGNRPAAAMITATSTSSFTVRIQEPDNEADTHGIETVAYIVMERGAYVLPDGRKVDVNTIDTSHYYGNAVAGASDDACVFTQTFSSAPVVLASLQSNNNTGSPDFLTASVSLVGVDEFACAMEVPDSETNIPANQETLGWIAIEGGVFSNNGIALEATTTSQSVTGWTDTPWYEKSFTQLFSGIPGFIATKRTRYGAEGGWVRYGSVDTDSVQMAFDERDDGERTHTGEIVSYLALSNGGVLYRAGTSDFSFSRTTTREFEFTIAHFDARSNVTYFFRLYDVTRGAPVDVSIATSYPSLSTAGASLSFSIQGVNAGEVTEGVTTDVTSTPTSVSFGSLVLNVPKSAAQRLVVTTNASEGYQILAFERQDLISGAGATIEDVLGTNSSPVNWATGCLASAPSCYGYHVGDNTLVGGSNRFLSNDTYAALTGSLAEVAYSSGPVTNESTDIIYRTRVGVAQPAGKYTSNVVYIVIPVF